MGGEATVTRSWNHEERGDADGLDDETATGSDEGDGAGLQTRNEEAEGGDPRCVDRVNRPGIAGDRIP